MESQTQLSSDNKPNSTENENKNEDLEKKNNNGKTESSVQLERSGMNTIIKKFQLFFIFILKEY